MGIVRLEHDYNILMSTGRPVLSNLIMHPVKLLFFVMCMKPYIIGPYVGDMHVNHRHNYYVIDFLYYNILQENKKH